MYRRHLVLAMVLSAVLSAPAADVSSGETELHAVGIYEGATDGGRALVTVDRPGMDVSLFLSSYDEVTWSVSIAPDTHLEQVILGGYHTQAVTGLPPDVDVIEAFYEGGSGAYLYLGYELNTPRFREAVRGVAAMTGLGFSSFQGTYRCSDDSPFRVNQVQDNPMLDPGYPFGSLVAELPDLSFQAVHITEGQHIFDRAASYGDFTLAGPIEDSLTPVPKKIKQIVADESRGEYYGLGSQAIYRVDLDSGTAEELDVGAGVPPLSWTTGVAYDSQRDRLLVSTLGGEGFLYSYEPASTEWSMIRSLNNIDLYSLAYDEKDDTIYGLAQPHGDTIHPVLHRFAPNGLLLGTTPLADPMLPASLDYRSEPQLISVDDYLVILKRSSGNDPFSRTYLVDPGSGQTHYVEPEPDTLTTVATDNWNAAATWDHGRRIVPNPRIGTVVRDHTVTVAADGAALQLRIDDPKGVVRVEPGKTLNIVEDADVAAGKLEVALSGRLEIGADLLLGDGAQYACQLGLSNEIPVVVAGHVYLVSRDASGDDVADILVNPWSGNVQIDTDSNTIKGYIIASDARILTGDPADNLPGIFQDDNDAMIASQFLAPPFHGVHNLGDVIGLDDLAGVELHDDLTFTYTVEGMGGIFDGGLAMNNDNTLALHATEFLGDLASGDWGEKTRTVLAATGIHGTFANEPALGDHLGMGVFHQGVSYDAHGVAAILFQAAPGDTDGDRQVDAYDIERVLAANKFGTGLPADWPEGDFTGDDLCNADDIQAILATDLYGEGPYAGKELGAAGDATLNLIITPKGLVIDPDGTRINSYVLTSEAGIFTGEPADNRGLFQEDEDGRISGSFAVNLFDTHLLGDVIGDEFTAMDLFEDLSFTYTIQGVPGTLTGPLVMVPEPGSVVLLAGALLGVLLWRRSRSGPR